MPFLLSAMIIAWVMSQSSNFLGAQEHAERMRPAQWIDSPVSPLKPLRDAGHSVKPTGLGDLRTFVASPSGMVSETPDGSVASDRHLNHSYFGQTVDRSVVADWTHVELTNDLLTTEVVRRMAKGVPAQDTNTNASRLGAPISATRLISPDLESAVLAREDDTNVIFDTAVVTTLYQEPDKQPEKKADTTQEPANEELNVDNPQDPATSKPEAKQETDIDELTRQIEDRKKLIEDNESLDETKKSEQLGILNQALGSLQKARVFQQFVAGQDELTKQYPGHVKRLQAEIDSPSEPDTPDLNKDSKLIQNELESKRKELQGIKTNLTTTLNRIRDREKRMAEIPTRHSEVIAEQKKIRQSIKDLQSSTENPLQPLQILVTLARAIVTAKELESLGVESRQPDEVGTLLTLEREAANRSVRRLDLEIEKWSEAQNQRRESELEQQKKDARQAYDDAIDAAPALKELAQRNQELVSIRSKLTKLIQDTREELDTINSKTEAFETQTQGLRQKVETTRMTPSLGMLLIEQRNDLTQPIKSLQRIEDIGTEIQRTKLATLELKDQRSLLVSPTIYVDQLLEDHTFPGMSIPEAKVMAMTLVNTQVSYDRDLENDFEKYRRLLFEVESSHTVLIDKTREFRVFVAQHALWIQSTNPISLADVGQSSTGLQAYFQRDAWMKMGIKVKARLTEKPYEPAIVTFLLLGLYLVKRRLKVMYV